MLKSKEKSENRTGEMGVIDDSDNLSHSEQLSQIGRYEGYVQIEKWEKIESTSNVRLEIRLPNGEIDEEFFDWPESSFSESDFGRLVNQLGYSAETVNMINEDQPLFPYDDGDFVIGDTGEDSLLRTSKLPALAIFFCFPMVLLIHLVDFIDGAYYTNSEKISHATSIWFGFCGFVWGVGLTFLFLL